MSMKRILFSIIKIKWMNSSHRMEISLCHGWNGCQIQSLNMTQSLVNLNFKGCPSPRSMPLYHLTPLVVAGGRSSPDCRPLNIPPGCWPLGTWPPGRRGPGAAS